MSRIGMAFGSFFGILFGGKLPVEIATAFGYEVKKPAPPPPPKLPSAADGAMQMLGILQRDARLVDFLMEDISGFDDDQVGAAVRDLHASSAQALKRYVQLAPVIDGVEGTHTKVSAAGPLAKDPAAVKLLGKVPADGKATGGTLRHKGWRAEKIDLPPIAPSQNMSVIAPAEIEIE